jgi:hypothetical protein
MLPLGGYWAGTCAADPTGAPSSPDEVTLNHLCTLGYARGNCAQFPAGNGPDAIRFTISADDGVSLRLSYVQERDHHPFRHGPLEYSRAENRFTDSTVDDMLRRQAHAYIQSYLRRKYETASRSAC